jgi:4-hydroxyproline epimerase
MSRRIRFIDSHTGGEPTRVLLDGIPRPARGGIADGWRELAAEHGALLSATVNEPRGSDILVGAVYWPPRDAASAGEVLFFNNVGLLGMCGHGTIGLLASLAHLGLIAPGVHELHTPVGAVRAQLRDDGEVVVDNVPAYRHRQGVAIDVAGYGRVVGDVAWGGNWFFIVEHDGDRLELAHRERLTELCWAIRGALRARGISGHDGAEIDHIELASARDATPGNDSRNFVLCPGKAYDRSPCGTGTSAKLACLAADGQLEPGRTWRQQGITGSVFEASFAPGGVDRDGVAWIRPRIAGRAQVTAVGELYVDEAELAACRWS